MPILPLASSENKPSYPRTLDSDFPFSWDRVTFNGCHDCSFGATCGVDWGERRRRSPCPSCHWLRLVRRADVRSARLRTVPFARSWRSGLSRSGRRRGLPRVIIGSGSLWLPRFFEDRSQQSWIGIRWVPHRLKDHGMPRARHRSSLGTSTGPQPPRPWPVAGEFHRERPDTADHQAL